jgi:hypothetical protein
MKPQRKENFIGQGAENPFFISLKKKGPTGRGSTVFFIFFNMYKMYMCLKIKYIYKIIPAFRGKKSLKNEVCKTRKTVSSGLGKCP